MATKTSKSGTGKKGKIGAAKNGSAKVATAKNGTKSEAPRNGPTKPADVKKLIEQGKDKGFLTYDEVNDVLPTNVTSPEAIDDIMVMFKEMDIQTKIPRTPGWISAKTPPGESPLSTTLRSGRRTTPCGCTCAKWGRYRF